MAASYPAGVLRAGNAFFAAATGREFTHRDQTERNAYDAILLAFSAYHSSWKSRDRPFRIEEWQWPFVQLREPRPFDPASRGGMGEPWSVLLRHACLLLAVPNVPPHGAPAAGKAMAARPVDLDGFDDHSSPDLQPPNAITGLMLRHLRAKPQWIADLLRDHKDALDRTPADMRHVRFGAFIQLSVERQLDADALPAGCMWGDVARHALDTVTWSHIGRELLQERR